MKRKRTAPPGTGRRTANRKPGLAINHFIRDTGQTRPSLTHNALHTTATGNLGARTFFQPLPNSPDDVDALADLVSQQTWENFLDDDHEWLTDDEACLEEVRKSKAKAVKREKRVTYLRTYLKARPALLDELLRLEHHGQSVEACGDCESTIAPFHRCRDCCTLRLYCSDCLVKRHAQNPLHAIETWNGRFFKRSWLADLGLRIQLGHHGDPCLNPTPAHIGFRIVHINGLHKANIDYCDCGHSSQTHVTQILRSRLFPTSYVQPRTAITLECLNVFHALTLQGKTTVYDLYHSIIHLTDNRGLDPILKSRYHECLQVIRIWRNLKMLKRAGRGNDPTGIPGTKDGALAVECPACPQPGRNLPDDYEADVTGNHYLNALYVAVDANFRLKLKNRKLADLDLAPAWAYYVDEQEYKTYTAAHGEEVEMNYCQSSLHAVDHANTASKSYAYNGVGACKCSRHSMIRPNGVGDLPKGEKYCAMDFILFSGIKSARVPCVKISYDIACQWCRNLRDRMAGFPECIRYRDDVHFVFGIPKFHLVCHGFKCQTKFSWNYLPGSARNHGESVEQDWPATNLVATSTREMSPAARRETLNDHWGFWNWMKVVHLASFLARSMKTAIESKATNSRRLEQFTRTFSPELIETWTNMITDWNADPSNPDPYTEDATTTLTLNGVRTELLQEDAAEMQLGELPTPSDGHFVSATQFLLTGLELEDHQRILIALRDRNGSDPTPAMTATLQERRNALFRRIELWRKIQERYMATVPALLSTLPTAGNSNVEDLPLLLPSALALERRDAFLPLARKEARLREAQADDALSELRKHLRIRHALFYYKKIQVRGSGQAPNTRARALIANQTAKIEKCVARYRAARSSLLVLNPSGTWPQRLLPLENSHVRHPATDISGTGYVREGVEKLGEGNRAPRSWIWMANPISSDGAVHRFDATDGEVDSSLRVEWTKSFARCQRWDEEVQLLASEMKRTILFYEWRQRWWLGFKGARSGSGIANGISNGADAYAQEQADGLSRMACDCAMRWIPLLRSQGIHHDWFDRYPLTPSPPTLVSIWERPSTTAESAPHAGTRPSNSTATASLLSTTLPRYVAVLDDVDGSDISEDSDIEDRAGDEQQCLEERVATLRLAYDNV